MEDFYRQMGEGARSYAGRKADSLLQGHCPSRDERGCLLGRLPN